MYAVPRPVIITADECYHETLSKLPELLSFCMHLSMPEQIFRFTDLLGSSLLMFVDVDSYDPMSFIKLIRYLEKRPAVYVVGVSANDDLERAIGYLKTGIHGYFL